MTATTIYGTAHANNGISRTLTSSGRIGDAHMIRRIELGLPEPGLEVTLRHDNTAAVGEVVYAELSADDRLNVVSVLADDWITDVGEDVFYSPSSSAAAPTSADPSGSPNAPT